MGKVAAGGWTGVGLCLVLSGCVPVAGGGAGSGSGGAASAPATVAPAPVGAPGEVAPPVSPEPGAAGAPATPREATPPTPGAADRAPGREGSTAASPPCAPTPGQEIVDAVNRIRRGAGLAPLQVDVRLAEAARNHTADMARRNRLGHDGSDGRQVQHRAEALGYDWLLIAENVASGQPTVADVMGSWMDSPGHRRNILSPDARHMGAAARASAGGRMYWTQVFGNTEVRVPPSGGCHP